ncbi:lytic murein transglycosylase [Mesorhizobium sp. B1-1-4]|nr:lytic murein transglycosylase [Mesorhizobium sp. B1-1-4]
MLYETPLRPAGHLPLEGGDWLLRPFSAIVKAGEWQLPQELPIFLQEGEMPGRAAVSAVECRSAFHAGAAH